jgi:predicted RNase H-like HicB family nuclease
MTDNSSIHIEQNYSILIETPKSGVYQATAIGLPDCRAKGATRDIALQNIKQILTDKLNHGEIVTLKIDIPQPEHPWTQFAGMFQNDPQFEDMLQDIQTYRQEIEVEEKQ